MVDQNPLYIFELDGVLANRETSEPLPGVAQWLEAHNQDFQYAICSKQDGVGLRYWMEKDGFGDPNNLAGGAKLPTVETVAQKFKAFLEAVPKIHLSVFLCYAYRSRGMNWGPIPESQIANPFWFYSWHKPAPGMIIAATKMARVSYDQTTLVGKHEDRETAINAGVHFRPVNGFFGVGT